MSDNSRLRDVLNSYQVGDSRDLGTLLPAREFINVTITSPPYWNIKDYDVDNQIGFGQRYEDYLYDLEGVFSAVRDRTVDNGSLWVVSDTFKKNGELRLLPFDISARLKKSGWILQDILIWQKDRTLPWSHQGKLRNIFEYIAFYSKTKNFRYDVSRLKDISDLKNYWVKYPERYSPEGKTPTRTWHVPIPRQGSWGRVDNYVRHACPLPPELVRRIIDLTTERDNVVFDPFAGSGSVLATAKAMNRKYVGIDLNPRYQAMFLARVLPALTGKDRANGYSSDAALKETFHDLIMGLRALKLAKEISRSGRDIVGMRDCQAILVVPADKTHVTYHFVLSTPHVNRNSFLESIRTLLSGPPLSKYGINQTLKVQNVENADRWIQAALGEKRGKLSVYLGGRFYKRGGRISAHELATYLKTPKGNPKYPTIISPLDIDLNLTDTSLALSSSNGKHEDSSPA